MSIIYLVFLLTLLCVIESYQQNPSNSTSVPRQLLSTLAGFSKAAGHNGRIRTASKPGLLLKSSTGNEELCLIELMNDELSIFVPKLISIIHDEGNENFLEMQDLTAEFDGAAVMDVKMGIRTFKESEVIQSMKEGKLRSDLYQKMIQVKPDEPTSEEHRLGAITKSRYLMWRDTSSSSASLGFRIEGMHKLDDSVEKNFKTLKDKNLIAEAIKRFATIKSIRTQFLDRLHFLRQILQKSKFFQTHQLIGSSLLFVHDNHKANIWLIDFAQTEPLEKGSKISHKDRWELGNHEDGYLIGLENLINIMESIQ